MPFFVMYLAEVFVESISNTYLFRILNEFFLWLGYSNSVSVTIAYSLCQSYKLNYLYNILYFMSIFQVLNPIIYTMYNGDFRRCFRDLLSFGCWQHHRRSMSVKKLHQQSTVF